MNVGNTVLSQLMSLIPDYELRKCVDRYRGDFHARRFTCRDQFLVMSYAQFTSSASLRSIEAQLTAFNSKLYHAGLKIMPKSTLADMNEKKNWRIYQDYAMILVDRAKALYKDNYYRLNIDNMVYAFDSSTINLCLQLCPWAKFHHDKGAFKMHTLVDVKNSIPNFVLLTPGNVHDSQAMDMLPIETGAYYLMDKGYVDFAEPQVDPQTGTFSVRAEMPNPKQVLLPGQFTKVKLLLDVREGAILVPMKAVTIEKGGAYIYTMRKDDTVEKRFIELGPEVGNNVVVERGLAVGETIVVEGFHKLTPGMKVRISQPEMEVKDTTMVAGDSTTGMKDNAKGE